MGADCAAGPCADLPLVSRGLSHIVHMQNQHTNLKENKKQSVSTGFFLLLDSSQNKNLAAATILLDLFNTISGYKNLEYFNSSTKSKFLLLV